MVFNAGGDNIKRYNSGDNKRCVHSLHECGVDQLVAEGQLCCLTHLSQVGWVYECCLILFNNTTLCEPVILEITSMNKAPYIYDARHHAHPYN